MIGREFAATNFRSSTEKLNQGEKYVSEIHTYPQCFFEYKCIHHLSWGHSKKHQHAQTFLVPALR